MGLSFGELIIIALAALVFIGPKDMPNVMRQLGSALKSVKKMSADFIDGIDKELEQPKNYIKDLNGNLQQTFPVDNLK